MDGLCASPTRSAARQCSSGIRHDTVWHGAWDGGGMHGGRGNRGMSPTLQPHGPRPPSPLMPFARPRTPQQTCTPTRTPPPLTHPQPPGSLLLQRPGTPTLQPRTRTPHNPPTPPHPHNPQPPGSLLLQRPDDGSIFYLVSEDLKQIDLSNDQVRGGGWGTPGRCTTQHRPRY